SNSSSGWSTRFGRPTVPSATPDGGPASPMNEFEEPATFRRRRLLAFSTLGRVLRRSWFGVAAGLLSAIALMRAVTSGQAQGWAPAGDEAVIATRAVDVLSRHTPLVGQASMATDDASVHAPGPALYWLLALPARIGPFWWQLATIAAVGIAALVLAAVTTERLVGR